ncbi:MAG: DeoR/GlpR transcriptional regulator [Caldilineaceae bacterium]|nr:DeoR/GlpR transcriptional regulator [Caldilineaceae bacterium]
MTLPEHRRTFILKRIEDRGSVTVVELAQQLDVSPMTIRRDLLELEQEGALRRVHGGAVNARGRSYEPLYHTRAGVMQAEKERIGRLAAELVADGDSLALDIGTTTLEVARCLLGRRNLTIVTPSLHITNLFLGQADLRLIVAGGIVRPEEGSMIGELARLAFERLHVDRLFLGVACIDAAYGLSEYNWDDALVKQAMIASAKEVVVVADSQKFGKVAFAHVAGFGQVHKLVTDRPPPEPLMAQLQAAGVSVLVAGAEEACDPEAAG